MKLEHFFSHVEQTLLQRFQASGFVQHAGDRGGNREQVLRDFLRKHLPARYGVTKGEIVTRGGAHTHSADIIIYDAQNCPVLYVEETSVLPVESVFGIVEVKSTLSKSEFVDAARKVEAFKRLAPRDLSVIETREYVTVHRPSRPFGIVLGYQLSDNSLDSLASNWKAENARIHDVNYFTNVVAVLGTGLLRFEAANVTRGEKAPLLGTDEFVQLVLTQNKRLQEKEPADEVYVRVVQEALGNNTFGRLFVYLLILLGRMRVGVPDLGRYLDPELPILVTRES
jgi:hypothetical protein